ncbi:MAG: hypothetical protein QF886_23755, partial [Planctomycetota bacterium]|nr:hypothetical protein [Planctomycetota bacterium]
MNHRERFVAIFEGRPVDHLPWLPDLTYWSEARRRRGRLPARYEGRDGGHHLCADFGACVYYGHSDSPALARMEGVTTTTQEHGDIIIDRVECEGHSLERHKRWMPGSCCYGIEKYYVTDVSQLAVVREI